jgi:hypothetical protein
MLAFNLGIFFRNLRDAEVDFAAHTAACHVQFIGRVLALSDQVDLTRHLAVTLSRGDLRCHISFDEQEDEEGREQEDEARVEVRLVERSHGAEHLLIKSQFRFQEISLKPHAPEGPQPPAPAQAA